ncbi:hypothetical protein M877_15655 [Streptomyces niveus NCIMB 11891]|nr:hypothetical protein M877_15655 [Streptomyces niveus NCIMB 11891]
MPCGIDIVMLTLADLAAAVFSYAAVRTSVTDEPPAFFEPESPP